jgi:uncharacterized protein (TIGR03790 family)
LQRQFSSGAVELNRKRMDGLTACVEHFIRWAAFVCIFVVIGTNPAYAGGGPENVLLIVNANSDSSKTIANNFIALRKIPVSNVVYIDWKGNLEIGSALNWRDKILKPALKVIEERHLMAQIDYIVYSSDFPWRVELAPLFPDHKFQGPFDPFASITGVTYLMPFVNGNDPNLVRPDVNLYVPGPIEANADRCKQLANVPSRGFRSRYFWDASGNRSTDPKQGFRYVLSTMLGVTQGRGNTVDEVISYLRRSASADAPNSSKPQGTIYFMWNQDIRSSTRDKCFESVAAQINALGVKAKVQQGKVPDRAIDVTGLMAGTETFDLKKSNITIRPGAICEHLTSAGGILTKGDFQTPLSEFLRHGAAGASGTVWEPRAIQAKFPLPSLQLHYARGCSLAEAFYQSVSGPYQLLIVGDPLCQPWATPPTMTVKGIKPEEVVKGTISINPSGSGKGGRSLGLLEVFIDGKLVAQNTKGDTLDIDTTKMPDGFHELRVVGSDSDPIETQGRQIVPFVVRNNDAMLEFKVAPYSVKPFDSIRVTVKQSGATAVVLRQNSREVGRVQGEAGEIVVPATKLGRGPSMLQAFSEGERPMASVPTRVLVE